MTLQEKRNAAISSTSDPSLHARSWSAARNRYKDAGYESNPGPDSWIVKYRGDVCFHDDMA